MAGYLNANLENLAGGDALSQALDFVGWNQKRQYNQEALRQQQINRDMALEDLFYSQQANPLRIKRMELDNEGTSLDNTFKGVTNKNKQRDWDVRSSIPLEAEQALAQAINENKITSADLDTADKQLEIALRSPDPNVRKQAEAILPLTKRMREIYAQGEERRKLEELKNQARALATATKAAQAGRKSDAKTLEEAITIDIGKHKSAKDKLTAVRGWIGKLGDDHPLAFGLKRMEAEILPVYNAEQRARTAGRQVFEGGQLQSPSGITLEPRQAPANKPDPLGIR